MGLFKPVWMSNNEKKALKAIEMENNQTTLFEIAMTASLDSVRQAARHKLSEQSFLVKIALTMYESDMQPDVSVISKLTDQAIIAQIVKKADIHRMTYKHWEHESYATRFVSGLNDPELLTDVAINADDTVISEKAVDKLTDPQLLLSVAVCDNYYVSIAAIKKVVNNDSVDELLLLRLAKEAKSREAVEKIENRDVLLDIAQDTNCHENVRRIACERVGKHQFSSSNKCRCSICDYKEHDFHDQVCSRCGGIYEVENDSGPRYDLDEARYGYAYVRYPDGTTEKA